MTALALAPAVLPGDDTAARLEALLDQGFLSGAGWDAQAMVLSPPASHPGLGWRVCEVPGCGGMAESRKGAARICGACYQYTVRNGLTGQPAAAVKTFTTGVGRCQVGCARPWESARRCRRPARRDSQPAQRTRRAHARPRHRNIHRQEELK